MKREWIVLLEASSGLGLGLTDMVSICKHLQYRKQQQAKEAVRLGPNGERPRLEFLTCSCVDVASSVYGVDLSRLIVFIAERGKLVTSPSTGKANRKAGRWCCECKTPYQANAFL